MTPALPRLDRLETLVLSDNKVISPGGDLLDVAPIRIITELPSARERALRLLRCYGTTPSNNLTIRRPVFANLTLLELDAYSFRTIRRIDGVFPSLTCRVALRCTLEELEWALAPSHPSSSVLPLTSKFEIWVHSDGRPGSPLYSSTDVEEYLEALISVAPNLSALTLPLNFGIGRNPEDLVQMRTPIYAFLKEFVRTAVPIRFHNGSWYADDSLHPDFRRLDETDGKGYFSDLVAGKVDDLELRNFRVVVV